MRAAAICLMGAAMAAGVAVATIALAAPEPQVIHLEVKRFGYSLKQIAVRKGRPVVIEIVSKDVLHGFSIPDLGLRTDVEPGKVERIAFTPTKSGAFAYLCDIFCGSGHGEVHGMLTVTD